MPLDPDVQAMLTMLERSGFHGMAPLGPAGARQALRQVAQVDTRDPAALPPVGSVEETTLESGLRARVYRPDAVDGPAPTIVFLHGGGFVIGDLDTHDVPARLLCRDVGAVVVSVDYPLAPEHPFPAGVDASWSALEEVARRIDEFGGDAAALVVAGDSAGANLAAVTALRARDEGLALAAQVLMYPTVDAGGTYASRTENGEGYFLTAADMDWFFSTYTGVDPDAAGSIADDPRIAPLRAASLAGLAPAVVVTAEFDPLRDEGEAYADALAAAGVRVERRSFDGLVHGFHGSPYPAARAATSWIHEALVRILKG